VLGSVLPIRHLSEPLPPGGVFAESRYCYRCPLHLSYPACDLACARDVERLIQFEDPAQIGLFVGETIQQGFGAVAPPPEYWPIIRQLCDRSGILLVVDEVICGFGRTGKWFGVQHFDLAPDMLLMAKGISSGYMPMGALGATEAVMAPVDNFANLQTYMNHPVACAASLANIEILKQERLIDNAQVMGSYFLDGLKSLAHHQAVGEVRGIGLWAALDLTMDRSTRALFPADRLERMVQRAKEKGLIIKYMHCALEFAPSLIVTRGDIGFAIRILDECLAEDEQSHERRARLDGWPLSEYSSTIWNRLR
jgi:adenosylmethionine-8-amino-7-oxononanoate aminotransferase